jgi:polar amino acid transport system substrate-binding protein
MIKLSKKYIRLLVAAPILAILAIPQAEAVQFRRVLRIAADPWCPISCHPTASEPGVGVEIARAIYEPLGYRIIYTMEPWTRALNDVRHGKIDAIIGADRSDDPTLVFPQKPISHVSYDFYALRKNNLRGASMATLTSKRIGAISGYGYGTLDEFIKAQRSQGMIQNASGEDALQQNIMKLLAGRIDVIVESSTVMDYQLARLDLSDAIERVDGKPSGYVYLAFSPSLPKSKELTAQFDAGMAKLAKSGALDTIYRRYHLPSPVTHAD